MHGPISKIHDNVVDACADQCGGMCTQCSANIDAVRSGWGERVGRTTSIRAIEAKSRLRPIYFIIQSSAEIVPLIDIVKSERATALKHDFSRQLRPSKLSHSSLRLGTLNKIYIVEDPHGG